MMRHGILEIVGKLLIPFVLIFALYVQFHGDFGPGGGFQAGVIFAAGFILYGLTFGTPLAESAAPGRIVTFGVALGVLIFGGVGIASILLGGNYLDYDVLAPDPKHGQHYGILLVEFGVGVTVASSMIALFVLFARRVRRQ